MKIVKVKRFLIILNSIYEHTCISEVVVNKNDLYQLTIFQLWEHIQQFTTSNKCFKEINVMSHIIVII